MAATVVLVHGAFADASGWGPIVGRLQGAGIDAQAIVNPLRGLTDDGEYVAATLAQIDGPVVLVGHSYGGVVITEAGNDPKVASLVYVAAFAPDAGESVMSLIANPPPGAPVPPILPPQDGFLALDKDKFAASFAGDVDPSLAQFMADSQVPWGLEAAGGKVTTAAWKSKPSHYLVATDDHMIPPPAQRQMAQRAGAQVTESPGSHSVYVSHPDKVAEVIAQAAAAVAEAPVTIRQPVPAE
jgi:pimeloyl-ACP methyl ester carboxylesterase